MSNTRKRYSWEFKLEAISLVEDQGRGITEVAQSLDIGKLHMPCTLPQGDADYSGRIKLIKYYFSYHIAKTERISNSRIKKGERGIWQRWFWEHCIRDEVDYRTHVDYIHMNPVKHGYVDHVKNWSVCDRGVWLIWHGVVNICWVSQAPPKSLSQKLCNCL